MRIHEAQSDASRNNKREAVGVSDSVYPLQVCGWRGRDGRSMRASCRAYVDIIVPCMFRWAQSRWPGVATHAPPFASSGLQGRRLRQHPV
jgi:hypothetical protein